MTLLQRYAIGDYPKQGMRVVDVHRGGMGIVYVVELDRMDGVAGGSGVKLALKTCPIQAAMTPGGRETVQREALTWLSLLPHPNVVKAMSFEIDGGLPTILMEYAAGGNLRDRLGTDGIEIAESLRVAMEICEGMVFLGEAAIIHRDLKPENVLFTEAGSAMVTDFGLATGGMALEEVAAAGLQGTLPYMAPEQLEPGRRIDGRSDIFAFGVIFHEMLAGRRPFDATTPSAMRRAQGAGLVAPRSANVPVAIWDIVVRCLQIRPEDRFQSFVELASALAAVSDAAGLHNCVPARVAREQLEAALDAGDWSNRGYSLKQLGDFDGALRCYQRSIDALLLADETDTFLLTPGVNKQRPTGTMQAAVTHGNMGMLLIAMGRLAEAKEAFGKALRIVPDDGGAYFGLGQVALAEDRHDEALALFRKSVECEPGNTDLLLKYVRLCAALGKRAEFEEGLAVALDRKRADAPFLVAMGSFLGQEIGAAVAIRFFDVAATADPASAAPWYNRGVALLREADVEGASTAYERALQLDRHHPYARFYAGIAALMAGRTDQAIFHLEQLQGRTDLGPLGEIADFTTMGLRDGVPAEILAAAFQNPEMIKYVA